MSIYDRPYPESRRDSENRRNPENRTDWDREFRERDRRYEDDDRGSWTSRNRDFERDEFRDLRKRDPFDPRESVSGEPFRGEASRDGWEPFDRDSYERRSAPERRRFERFEDWQRPRELASRNFRSDVGRYAGRGPKGYQRSDERLKDEICDRLTADPYVDASDLTVSVKDGEVTLEGTVPSRFMKRGAEECAEEIAGVRQVQNRLRIETGEGRRDEDHRTGGGARKGAH